MNIIEWEKKFELGVDSIDREHKQLFSIINKLLVLIKSPDKNEFACQEVIKYLNTHTVEHFTHEEDYMQSVNYGDYEMHKRIHDDFRDNTLPALKKELTDMRYSDSSVRHFIGVVIGWLVSHTITADMLIIEKDVKKWTNVPHEKQEEALEQSVIKALSDIFQLTPKTVSLHYEGEDFGNMVCISLIYRGQNGETWNVILSYEESLLLYLVSNLLNVEYPKCNDIVINITRHVSRQLIESIRNCFPMLDLFEFEGESLMTYGKLLKQYEQEPPSSSMLFDMGKGYVSFSIFGTDFIENENAYNKKEEDVTSDIWRYLNSGHRKKKVLVVDDSEFMRFSIVKLLEDDYEVTECSSAMSAIVKLVTEKPDLVVLDYEMPICDGRQMLEMLRSEKTTMDIAVIFLTGRSDEESIKKVIALNPNGYLLKTKSREYVKKSIDGFFAQLK